MYVFSVSNHELLHLRTQPATIVLGKVDGHIEDATSFSGKKENSQLNDLFIRFKGYFEYQLQTGVVLAFDTNGHPIWSSAINAPIAAVWELKNGQLNEKSLFETTTPSNHVSEEESGKR